jgi:hypothetical protein
MAGTARLRILLGVAVVFAHLAALDWFAGELDHGSVLRPTVMPMFTRLLQPQAPQVRPQATAAPARPKRVVDEDAIAAKLPTPSLPESTVTSTVAAQQPEPEPKPGSPETVAQAEPAVEVAAPAREAMPAADPAPAGIVALDSWPGDTRLSYRLGGVFREGELYGDARVQWQREGSSYQVRLDIDITPWVTMVMTSQGEVTEQGLVPHAYEEERRGKRRAAQFGPRAIQLENGRSALKPEGVQDTASQFVELAHRFATGRDALEVGKTVSFWMARPSAVDLWTYDVVKREVLQTPQLGAIEAFHLKPRPIANPRGNVTAEMWFAPSLQYLPVRIRVNMGEQAYVDLMVDKIEQR